ncbi:MAG: tetratricopeptide repeat protein [Candidatus Adiutrix sp.]
MVIFVVMLMTACSKNFWGDSDSSARTYYYFIKSNYSEMSRQDPKAAEYMAVAAKEAGDSYFLELEASRLYFRTGDNGTALEYAQRAINIAPEQTEARLFAAWMFVTSSNWQKAEEEYQQVLRLDPENVDALVYMGAIYMETGRSTEAEKTFKKLIKVEPSHLSYYYLGRFYTSTSRPQAAIHAFEMSIKKDATFNAAYAELAALYEQRGDLPKAVRTYKAMIKNRPDSTMPKARLARLFLKSGRMGEAEKLLKEVRDGAANSEQAVMQTALIYMELGFYQKAIEQFEALLIASPENDQALYLLATTLLENTSAPHDLLKARESLMKVSAKSSLYEDARLLLASTTFGLKDAPLEESLSIISNAASSRPDSARLQVAQAMILDELGQTPKARRILRRAAKKFQKDPEVHFRLGVIEDKLGNSEASILAMKTVIALDPNHPEALNYLAYTWAERQENLEEALIMAEKAIALKPNSGHIIDTIGWVHYMMGNYPQALAYLQKAAELLGDDPVIMEHLGDTFHKLGRTIEAKDAYDRALANGHDNQEKVNGKINNLAK